MTLRLILLALLVSPWQVTATFTSEIRSVRARDPNVKTAPAVLPGLEKRQYQGSSTIAAVSPYTSSSNTPQYTDDGPPSAAAEGGTGRRTTPTTASQRRSFEIAHGTIMAITFVLIFPLGGILIRSLSTPSTVWLHATVQIFGYVLAATGLGLGVWLGLNVRYLDYAHTVIGMVIFGMLAVQAGLGVVHHRLYRSRREKNVWTGMHVWLGRVLICLGVINGGLRLQLAENTRAGTIAYGSVAGVVGMVYVGVVLFVMLRADQATKAR